ncbi:putative NADH-ubiquinone oxidoreductase 18 kDa subunit [Purpureocillium lavendulum]|uniref:NADH-ubiquinone oxidoreductase 18 kDa subunit n=1 Tax=Purpureocillium lavendulum TaxID=1247861 RepID=A0AB34FUN4_9HYPO|nr:putative NADH-ubiquinone oxidoreductase 18 kDa subunit [Purpureocillium lavendulum]
MAFVSRASRSSMRERSIRVLVSPTPVTFAERRSVLQVLEQYGPVDVFRMAPGYHSNFVSVTKEPATATKLVASSPLTYKLPKPRPRPDIYTADLDEPQSFHAEQPDVVSGHVGSATPAPAGAAASAAASAAAAATNAADAKEFKLDIFPATEYNHAYAMSGSALHHSWPEAYAKDRSFVAATLKQALPKTVAAEGLSHWLVHAGRTPKMDHKAKRLQLKSWLPSKMMV